MALRFHQTPTYSGKGWTEYLKVIQARFEEELYGDPMLEMKNLRQERSFVDYQREFNHLLHNIQLLVPILEKSVLSQFLGGLDHRFQGSVCLQRLQKLREAYTIVKLHESIERFSKRHSTTIMAKSYSSSHRGTRALARVTLFLQ